MKSNFLKNKIQLGEIKYNQFALNIYKQNNAIQLGFISNDNIWNGYTENQNKRYIGQCLNELKSGLGYLLDGTFSYIGEFKSDKFNGIGKLVNYAKDFERRDVYVGFFKDGIKEGLGSESYYLHYKEENKTNYWDGSITQSDIYGKYHNGNKEGIFISEITYGYNDRRIHELLLFKDGKLIEKFDFFINLNFLNEFLNQESDKIFNLFENELNELFKNGIDVRIIKSEEYDKIKFEFIAYYNENNNEYLWIELNSKLNNYEIGINENGRNTMLIKSNKNEEIIVNNIKESQTKLILNNDEYYYVSLISNEYEIIESHEQQYSEYIKLMKGNLDLIKLNNYESSIQMFTNYFTSFKLTKDKDQLYFSVNENGAIEVISISEMLNVEVFKNNNDIKPRLMDENNYYDFQHVSYKTILEYNELSIDCTIPYYLFIDTETNGLPVESLDNSNVEKWPRIIQIAYLVYSKEGVLLSKYSSLIKPNNFRIENNHISGIDNDMAIRKGEEIEDFLFKFKYVIDESKIVVCHNANFDINVLNAEFSRLQIENCLHDKEIICTMLETMNFMNSQYYTKLSSLYQKLFNAEIVNAHDALADVEATAKCFWKLKDMKLINVA